MAGMTDEQKKAEREKQEAHLASLNVPEEIKQKARNELEKLLLAQDAQASPTEIDHFGAEKWDDAVQRYRDLGARTRAPVQIDQRQADQTRGLQIGALGTLERAARGGAPSQAALTGQLQAGQIQQGATQSIGGGRGAAASLTASRGAQNVMGNQLVGSLAGTTLGRAAEATADRNAFAQGAGAVRGQDIGAATTNAELLAKSRAQDEARQQGFEKMGWNTRNAQLGANVELQRQKDDKIAELRRLQAADSARDSGAGKTAASVGSAALMAVSMFSDKRTKYELPMGALGHIGRK